MALNDMVNYLKTEGDVSLYDGTNTTKKRRRLIMETLKEKFQEVEVFWVESICNDEDVIQRNIKLTKLNNPDYANKNPEEATSDFIERIEQYKKVYEPISEDENISFIKIIDIGKDVMVSMDRKDHHPEHSGLPAVAVDLVPDEPAHLPTADLYVAARGKLVQLGA